MTYKYIDGMVIPIPDLPDSTTSSKGILQLTSDLSGTATSPLVAKLQGNPVKNQGLLSSLQDGYVATWVNGDGYIEFKPSLVSSGSVVPGSSGQFFITNSTPASAWTSLVSLELTHGRLTAGGTGTDHKTIIGPLVTAETSNSAMWFLPSATIPTVSNYTMQGDWNNGLAFNVPTSGTFSFYVNGTTDLVNININGFSAIAGANWQWASTAVLPIISQAAPAATAAGQNLTLAPQAGGATSGQPGSLQLNIAAPNGGSAENFVKVQRGGTNYLQFGPLTSFPTLYAAIYPGGVTPGASNYYFEGSLDGTIAGLNAITTLGLAIANSAVLTLTSSTVQIGVSALTWQDTIASPTISQTARTTDAATNFLKLKAQDAWNNVAATHTTGGDIWLEPGASSTANGQPGSIHVYLPSNSSAYRGKFYVDDAANGVSFATGAEPQYGTRGIWVAADAASTILGSASIALYGSTGGFTALNATSNVGFMIGGPAGSQVGTYSSTAWTIGNGTTTTSVTLGTATGGTIALQVNSANVMTAAATVATFIVGTVQHQGPNIQFSAAVTGPNISQQAQTSNVANNNITISPQAPWNNVANTFNDAGDLIVNTPVSVNGSTAKYGGFQVQYNSAVGIRMGVYGGGTSYAGIWFKDAGSPNANNFGFLGNQSFTYLNVAAGGNVVLSVGGTSAQGLTLSYGAGNMGLLAGTSVTDLIFGTNVASGKLDLYADAGALYARFQLNSVQIGVTSGNINLIGSIQHTLRTSSTSFAIDTTTTDTVVTLTATQSVTLPTPTTGRALEFWINLTGGGAVDSTITFVRHASETINGVSASLVVGPFTAGSMSKLLCRSDGTNWFISS